MTARAAAWLASVALSAALFGQVTWASADATGADASATASDAAPENPRPQDELQPPELVAFVEAPYPREALALRAQGSVVLKLTIDAEGRVSAAEVTERAGYGFDEAARAAALRFVFRPAQRGARSVASRIRYRYEFRLPPSPMPAPPPPAHSSAHIARGRARPGPEILPRAIEVTVRGTSANDRLKQSAQAVTVVETSRARRESADLGEVLARSNGVGVQREGGLGSSTRFSLNGLIGEQVRFFLDGVPLELAGYPFGVANVPVNLVEQVEIYSGVVPIRFGADALGGAVNLATSKSVDGTHGGASYELGSFDTQRLSLSGRHLDAPSRLFVRVNGFADYARNDYPIEVDVPNEKGKLTRTRVYRFHDAYRADGANVEFGVLRRPWARRLLVRAFLTDYAKDYQNNVVMTVPYGGVSYAQTSGGTSVHYENSFAHWLDLDATAGLVYTRGRFLDDATCIYDWFGRCVGPQTTPGETDSRPHDTVLYDRSAFARLNAGLRVAPEHALHLAFAPTFSTRVGEERIAREPGARDPASAQRDLLTLVNGLEYQADLWGDRLENIAFVKQYVQSLASEEPRPGNLFRRRDRATARYGFGDGLRYRITSSVYAKASYEWATRLPRPDEVFGDNAFVVANLALEPEKSHNVNVGFSVNERDTAAGSFRASANGFLRKASNLIVLLGNDATQSSQNVWGGRALGVEGGLGWTSAGEYLVLDANATYQDFRNTSDEGAFSAFDGDRIPNRPYLFGAALGRLQFRHVFSARDELTFTWNTRYVHEYFRAWESVGLRSSKQIIPAQLVHSVGGGYRTENDHASLSTSIEMQNLTDAAVYDFFGVQRPGRAIYFKTTTDF